MVHGPLKVTRHTTITYRADQAFTIDETQAFVSAKHKQDTVSAARFLGCDYVKMEVCCAAALSD